MRRLFICVFFASALAAQLRGPKNLDVEKNAAAIQRKPGIVIPTVLNSLPPSFIAVAQPQGFRLTDSYFFENAAQAIAPGANNQCSAGRIVLATGTDPVTMKLRTMSGAAVSTAQLPLPATAAGATDHMLLKLKDGSLLALRTVVTWGPHPFIGQPLPPWWNKVTIQGKPNGARVAIMAFRSTNCGSSWTHIGTIDPLMYHDGRFAVPRPTEANCPSGCFGGWDRVDAYADPFTGHIWVTAFAAGGPIIDYATGKQKEAAKTSNFVWVSMNGGQDFHSVLEFGVWTPMVITSTPNGRVYVFSHVNTQPKLYYTLLSSKTIKFSAGKPINFVSKGQPIPGAGDDAYGTFVYKATNAISRISTDATSSKVRLAYQYVDSKGKTGIAVVRAEIPANDGDPIVTPIRTIRASSADKSTLAAAFIDADTGIVNTTKSNTALLYWIEGSLDKTVPSQARYVIFNGDSDFSLTGSLSGTWTPTTSVGHYMTGASFLGVNKKPSFVA